MRMIAAGLMLITMAGEAPAQPKKQAGTCGLRQPMTCHDTNDFIQVEGVQAAIRTFLGDETVMEVTTVRKASDYAIASLFGPPDKPAPLGEGFTMLTAC